MLVQRKKRSDTQSDTPSLSQYQGWDAPHSRHSNKSHGNQPIGYYKESSDW